MSSGYVSTIIDSANSNLHLAGNQIILDSWTNNKVRVMAQDIIDQFTMVITGDRVGIGTTNPGRNLDVSNPTANSYIRISGPTNVQQGIELWDTQQRWAIYKGNSSTSLFWYNGSTNVMTLLNNGNLGLGVTPSFKLDVNGGGRFTGLVQFAGGATISSFLSGTWINMPTTGASAIGSGGAGVNAWMGYTRNNGEWFNDAVTGDICYRNTVGRMLFGSTEGPHNMAITSTTAYIRGNFGIGTTSPGARLDVNRFSTATYVANTVPAADAQALIVQNSNAATSAGIYTTQTFQLSPANTFGAGGRAVCDQRFVRKTTATSEAALIWGSYNSAGTAYQDIMELNTNTGNLTIRGTLTSSSTFSDERLKHSICNVLPCLDKVATLRPIEYTWKEDVGCGNKRDVGLIAQEVADVFPLVVTSANNLSDGQEYMGIRYERFVPYLIKSIQELRQEVKEIRGYVDTVIRKI